MKFLTLLTIAILLLIPVLSLADDDFKWSPVEEKDWSNFTEIKDSNLGAIILFERIETDDTYLIDNECYYSIYKRIRILNHKGRDYADIQVPYLSRKQEIKDISGRTVLPDGTIIPLEERHIFEKSVFRSSELNVNQKSFFLPGVIDNCIIEYHIKIRLERPINSWEIEKDLHLLKGQLIWKFYRGKGLNRSLYKNVLDFISPNYIWLNTKIKVKTEQRPNIKAPEEVVFSVNNVHPFKIGLYKFLALYQFFMKGYCCFNAFHDKFIQSAVKALDRFIPIPAISN